MRGKTSLQFKFGMSYILIILAVLALLYQLGQEGSQLIIATHSPILLGLPEAAIYSFDGEAVHPVSYEETESYQVTKMFLTRREQMLEELLRQ